MKHMRSLLSTAQALRQVFLPPQTILRSQYLRPSSIGIRASLRPFTSTPEFLASRPKAKPEDKRSSVANLVKDEAITAEYVQLVNVEGTLDPPVRTWLALRRIDRAKEWLIQVKAEMDGAPPVCKVVNKAEYREQERARAKAAHAARTSLKQVELNWAIDNHDLSHRLKKITEFITKGHKVEVVLLRKKYKRAPKPEEVKNVMDKVVQTIKEANGMQIKPMEGEPGNHVLFTVKKKPDQQHQQQQQAETQPETQPEKQPETQPETVY
ncbi:putative translation initiation factor IF3 [Aspergillus homomorphus CBS 101889]|uniref:Translation initiation factor 3 N-terminal domain-containing protein n=1 Tax=Aspergillus homomorphus (strain CBS 101889) TaxID=1450537 RepID=A0A395HIJ9_ASPHC|nr:hypothetical protein BO97DRAFT_408852 [Aspergillus homomorphus CBS 101889]RAL07637.1 hypothetical protein BO97DRAFT_408852 [Aspergillus homomorphus CBS 101889]